MNRSYKLKTFFLPPACICCRRLLGEKELGDGSAMCPSCAANWKRREKAKYLCSIGKGGVPAALSVGGCYDFLYLAVYRPRKKGSVESFVHRLKRKNSERAFSFAAKRFFENFDKVSGLLETPHEDILITYPPRRYSAVKDKGFDQAQRLAEALASVSGMDMHCTLERTRIFSRQQKKKDTQSRARSAQSDYVLIDGAEELCHGKTVILVDDLLTTGATLGVCSALLLSGGAKRVITMTVAHTMH